jgi:hypothetical protein
MVRRFIKKDLICHYDVPTIMITDNAYNFNRKLIDELCTK